MKKFFVLAVASLMILVPVTIEVANNPQTPVLIGQAKVWIKTQQRNAVDRRRAKQIRAEQAACRTG